MIPVPIADVRAWPVRQPHDKLSYVIVRVDTASGVSGWGEASPGTDAVATARRIESAKIHLVSRDALSAESVHLSLARGLNGTAHETAAVQAAVNMALVDILGKVCKAPAYDVLGGATRAKARALAPLSGDWMESLKRAQAAGHRAMSVPLAIPEGPVRGRGFYRQTRQSFEKLREAAGEGADFVLDCGPRATAAEAAGLARELESFHLLWMEASGLPTRALADIGAESVTPVGHGRNLVEVGEFQDLLRADALDALRPDVALWGVSALRKAAALAETYYIALAPHHRGGPIATAAALQAAASIPNFFIQEVPLPEAEADRRMRQELAGAALEKVTDGWLALPAGPGLGVTINEEALARYRIP